MACQKLKITIEQQNLLVHPSMVPHQEELVKAHQQLVSAAQMVSSTECMEIYQLPVLSVKDRTTIYNLGVIVRILESIPLICCS